MGASACLVLAVSPALAADLPAPPPAAPVYNWTGFYTGIHVGYGWGRTDSTVLEDDNNFFPQGTVNRQNFTGLVGGGQVGLNYQTGQWVFGVEGQFSGTTIQGSNFHEAILLANRHTETNVDLNWLVTATGRLGITSGAALFYVKGGGAWADFNSSTLSKVTTTGQVTAITTGGETRSGWTVGGGVEYMLSSNVSLKGEYSFVDFGTERVDRTQVNLVTNITQVRQRDNNTQMNIVKFGINYRWGAVAAPVTASY